eukprot:365994-Chlamydomonas_euryale.AAC.5
MQHGMRAPRWSPCSFHDSSYNASTSTTMHENETAGSIGVATEHVNLTVPVTDSTRACVSATLASN